MTKTSRQTREDKAALKRALERSDKALDIILSLDHQILRTSFNLNDLLSEMLKELCELTGAQYAQILLRRGSAVQITHSTQLSDKGQEFLIEECVSGLAVTKRKTISSGDVARDFPHLYKWVLGFEQQNRMKSEVAVPILVPTQDRVATGVINIESPKRNAFSKNIESLVERYAFPAGAAVHMARIQAGLGLTFELTESIERGKLKPHEALRNTLRQLGEFFRNDVVIQFLLYNPTSNTLRIESSTVESTEGQRVLISDSFSGEVISQRQGLRSNNVRRDYPEHFKDTVGAAGDKPTQSELAVPVFEDERPIGVLNIESPNKDAFDEHDQYVLGLFASNASLWKRVLQARRTQAREEMATIGEVSANMIHILRSDLVRLRPIANELEAICGATDPPLPVLPLLEELRSIATSAIKRSQDAQEKYKRAVSPPEKSDINKILRDVVGKIITRQEIQIVEELDEEMPIITVSPGIRDVIWSLVSNSQKAMSDFPSGLLRIGTKAIKGLYTNQVEAFELFVIDTGKGIPDDIKEDVFQLGVSEGDSGHGWGLFIVGNFVERWNGKIELQTQVGKGTSINLWFPLTVEGGETRLKGGQ